VRIANATINAMQDRMLQMLASVLVCGKLSKVRQGFEGYDFSKEESKRRAP
jgi:hypothetical protein